MSKAPSDNQYFGTEKTMKILLKTCAARYARTAYSNLYII